MFYLTSRHKVLPSFVRMKSCISFWFAYGPARTMPRSGRADVVVRDSVATLSHRPKF
jgi:hypothetical protein